MSGLKGLNEKIVIIILKKYFRNNADVFNLLIYLILVDVHFMSTNYDNIYIAVLIRYYTQHNRSTNLLLANETNFMIHTSQLIG